MRKREAKGKHAGTENGANNRNVSLTDSFTYPIRRVIQLLGASVSQSLELKSMTSTWHFPYSQDLSVV